MFQENPALMATSPSDLDSNGPEDPDSVTVDFLKDKKVTLQCKENNSSTVSFSRHAVETHHV